MDKIKLIEESEGRRIQEEEAYKRKIAEKGTKEIKPETILGG